MKILGISAFYHDSAAALVIDGRVEAAAQEERFTRKRHDPSFPSNAINSCLNQVGFRLEEIDHAVFYDKPFLKFDRLQETYLAFAPRGFSSFRSAFPIWVKDKLFQKKVLSHELMTRAPGIDWASRLLFSEHHLSHAASAFFPSPYDSAAILTVDGVGEWATTLTAIGRGNELTPLREIHFPHSIGLLYSAFTFYLGFKVNSAEYKVMGLAPFGTPRYSRLILDELIDLKADGSFWLNQKHFNYAAGLTMTNKSFGRLFGGPPRRPDEPLTQRHMDLAASVQSVTEEAMLRITRFLAKETGCKNLCLAGGVALNCVANGRILRDGAFENIWVQPAAGDAGGAIGSALAAYHLYLKRPREVSSTDSMNGAYLGPDLTQENIESSLRSFGANFSILTEDQLINRSAEVLADGKVLAWHQGRMEFGPRALGNRSILADPRPPEMQRTLNLKVKFRESFRPFAPSVLREDVKDWFECDRDSPYMLLAADVVKCRRYDMTERRSEIPAVTHVDYSARIQTVRKEANPRFHALISRFKAITGCPILVNTSFNVRGEPIVNTPEEAFRCFMGTGIDYLAIGNCFLAKLEQNPALLNSYRDEIEPD